MVRRDSHTDWGMHAEYLSYPWSIEANPRHSTNDSVARLSKNVSEQTLSSPLNAKLNEGESIYHLA